VPTRRATSQKLKGNITDCFIANFLVEHVLAKQPLTSSWAEWVEVNVPRLEAGTAVVKRGNARCVNKNKAALAGSDKSQDARGFGGAAGHYNDVVNLAKGRATGVQQWQSHDAKGVDQFGNHDPKATRI
jgi:hypothetical protein